MAVRRWAKSVAGVTVLVWVLLPGHTGVSAADSSPLWLRYPALSPDGATIAFTYQGQLYRVPSAGGEATRLTRGESHSFMPVWSPDGQTIAFASNRFGNYDVFVMPVHGGTVRRLTFHSADDLPSSFSPDGKFVLFGSRRPGSARSSLFPAAFLTQLYAVPAAGGRERLVIGTPALSASFNRDGTLLLYEDRKSVENEWRKHHRSPVARDVWLYTPKDGSHTRLTTFQGEDRNPVWAPDGRSFYYLSERSGSFNVWSQPLTPAAPARQLTFHERHPVRFLSASLSGDLCYAWDGEIYLLKAGAEGPQRVPISVAGERGPDPARFVTLTSGASELAVSPSGREVAFVVRGHVFVTSVDSHTTRRITSAVSQHRWLSFSPDGRALVYAAERGGRWQIYRSSIARDEEPDFSAATVLREEAIVAGPEDAFQPVFSPTGREIAYLEARTTLKVLDLRSRQTRTVLSGDRNHSYVDGDLSFSWSPDGRWLLSTLLDPYRANDEVALVDAAGQTPFVNLTKSGFAESAPRWSADGSMAYWLSDRYGLRGTRKDPAETDVFGMFLTREALDRFRLTRDELNALKEREGRAGAPSPGGTPVPLELDGIRDRLVRLTPASARFEFAALSPDNEWLVAVDLRRQDAQYRASVYRLDLREQKLAQIAAGVPVSQPGMEMDRQGRHLYLLAPNGIGRIDPATGRHDVIPYRAEILFDRARERELVFDHVWRLTQQKFYDPSMHGVDWDGYGRAYRRFLPHIATSRDFAELLSEMVGELNTSHSGAYLTGTESGGDQTASLGLFYDHAYEGPGVRVAEVMRGGPLDRAGSRVAAGVIIERVDDRTLEPETDIYPLLNRKAGRPTLLSLRDERTGERWVELARPITLVEESELLYKRWSHQRHELVERLSGRRLGYVHVRRMDGESFREFFSHIFAAHDERDGLVVDTRFNGGGNLHDELAMLLTGRAYLTLEHRGKLVGREPLHRWAAPSVLVVNEGNYSDASVFPWVYRSLGVGKLVGAPVAGTGTGVWWEVQVNDEIKYGIPQGGMRLLDGRFLENLELLPEVLVLNDPATVAEGRDRQLEAAIQTLMSRPAEPVGGKGR